MIDSHARDVDRDERAVMLALWSACHMASECGWSLAEVLRALMMAWSRAKGESGHDGDQGAGGAMAAACAKPA